MCFLELGILWLYQFFPNPWIIVLGLIPLALVYNTYAGAKFVTLPQYFASNLKPLFADAHSWFLRIGGLSGALVSGILISKYG